LKTTLSMPVHVPLRQHPISALARLGRWLSLALVLAWPSGAWLQTATAPSCALVLMHGKWGGPQGLAVFANKVESTCHVVQLEMPWSGRRAYDQPYAVALKEISAQVQTLRGKGYRQVLVGGQSFGTNAALAYMAEVGDADGVLALAPGHSPRVMYQQGMGRAEVDQARTLVAAGQGAQTLTINDMNQGRRRNMSMSAETLLSYFDPDGLGHMPKTSANFKIAVPVLWVIGAQDPLYPAGEAYAYAKQPAHAKSRYLVVDAGHGNTPDVAITAVIEWLKGLE
jgi:pimeloyl-ACP methyl ester carboxylesterase